MAERAQPPTCLADCDTPIPGETDELAGIAVDVGNEIATPEAECLVPNVGTTRARLLTRFEYDNTLRDILFDKSRPAKNFPPENRILAFDNDSRTHTVSPLLVEQYQGAAEQIAARAVREHLTEILPCDPENGRMACGVRFVEDFLRKAFRGNVTEDEAEPYINLVKYGIQTESFEAAIEMVIEAVLQSPRFLYRIEYATAGDQAAPADPFEIASRLSYFLWSSTPDEELLSAAESGVLTSQKEIETQARRMLADVRARQSTSHFFMQWLDLEGLGTMPKDPNAYPEYRNAMRRSWVKSMEDYFEHVVFERGTIHALMMEPMIFLDDVLEPIYGRTPDPAERAGLLTQPALLAKLSHPDQGSPIRRGVFVRERILCQILPSPPNDVDIVPPDPDPNATTRERFAEHTSNETCRGCHSMIDPIGFGFEQYDGLGRFRATENGRPIDASGELNATRDPEIQGPFNGAIELSEKLASSSEVRSCLVTQLFRYAMGRQETMEDQCTLKRLENSLLANDGRIDELLVSLTLTSAFRMKREEDSQ